MVPHRAWDVAAARETGLIHSFLMPMDKAFPMVAAKDVGLVAADLIQEDWTGIRVVELEGPCRVTPNDLADAFARVFRKPVRAVPVPRESWDALFRSQGMINESWIEFRDGGSKAIKGRTNAVTVIAGLVASTET